jgi:endonuclease-3
LRILDARRIGGKPELTRFTFDNEELTGGRKGAFNRASYRFVIALDIRFLVKWRRMKAESSSTRTDRLEKIIAALKRAYPEARCELNYQSPLELLIATILSARCTDKQVNRVTVGLFQKYRSARDFALANLAELEQDLKTLGLFRNKAKSIQACCRKLVEEYGGKVPGRMEDLLQLDGVGRKTANVVLGNAFGVDAGVVVDTHVARLAQRLGLTRQKQPEKIELDLQHSVNQSQWTLFSHWLIWHGRRRCFARNPECGVCEIRSLCPSAGRV